MRQEGERPVPILARISHQGIQATDKQEDGPIGAHDRYWMTADAISQALPSGRPLPPFDGHERKRADVRSKDGECIFLRVDHLPNMGVMKVVAEAPMARRSEH